MKYHKRGIFYFEMRAESKNKITIPDDIHSILEESLIDAKELNAQHRNTEKYYVDGHPDLLVRLNRGDFPGVIKEACEAVSHLRKHGVNVLPFEVVEHEGEAYVITQRVHGHSLNEELKRTDNMALVQECDLLWRGLVLNLMHQRKKGRMVPTDIEEPHQYMTGTIACDTRPKVWLVDLSTSTYDPRDERDYAEQGLFTASGIIKVEAISGRSLPLAREALGRALRITDGFSEWPEKLGRAAEYSLAQGVELWPDRDDEFIDDTF